MEWARANINSGLLPNSTHEARKEAVRKYGFLKRIPRRWAMWKALEDLINGKDEASGRVIVQVRDLAGNVIRTIPPSSALEIMAGARV